MFKSFTKSHSRSKNFWLRDKNGNVTEENWNKIIGFFNPIAHLVAQYARLFKPENGFTLDIIFRTIGLPSFAPLSADEVENKLRDSFSGDHKYRFSSSFPMSFSYDYLQVFFFFFEL